MSQTFSAFPRWRANQHGCALKRWKFQVKSTSAACIFKGEKTYNALKRTIFHIFYDFRLTSVSAWCPKFTIPPKNKQTNKLVVISAVWRLRQIWRHFVLSSFWNTLTRSTKTTHLFGNRQTIFFSFLFFSFLFFLSFFLSSSVIFSSQPWYNP